MFFPAGKVHSEDNPYAETTRLETTDQYMMGPSILVAPVFAGQKSRKVVLPRGNWYDFYTGDLAGSGKTITIKTKLAQIPLFVKNLVTYLRPFYAILNIYLALSFMSPGWEAR